MAENTHSESKVERMLRSGEWIDPMDPVDLTSLADRYARRRRLRIVAGAVATAVVVAGGSVTARYVFSDRESPPPPQLGSSDQPVPWVDTKPPAQNPPPSTTCPPDQLTISQAGAGAWHNEVTQSIKIRNDSGTACTLPTAISATVPTKQGDPIPVDFSALPRVSNLPVALEPGQTAYLGIGSGEGCSDPGHVHVADTVTVRIGNGSPVVLTGARVLVDCGSRPHVLDLDVVDIEPPTLHTPVSAKISAPAQVPAGTTLKFTVTLTNDSTSPISFDGCPSYTMGLKPTGVGADYQLNCTVSPNLDARQSRTYEMILDVPASAVGGDTLVWALYAYPAGDDAQVTVQ